VKHLSTRITTIQADVEQILADGGLSPEAAAAIREADVHLQRAYLLAEFGEAD
jgi:hypothetical protein